MINYWWQSVGRHQTCPPARKISLLLGSIVYKVIPLSHCELKRELLYYLDICNDIIS